MHNEVVVTLFEGHYHYGVAALINSLSSASFKGLVSIGYRGELPGWTKTLSFQDGVYKLNQGIFLEFVELDVNMHFGYYKPEFIKNTFLRFPDVDAVYYFDPDIVINAPWSFFNEWVKSGVTLCLDACFAYLHRNHPWRKQWLMLGTGLTNETNQVDYYVNSGFIGISKIDQIIVDNWIAITKRYKESGKNTKAFEQSCAHSAYKGDQDLLNAAITITPNCNYSLIGTEGMGFTLPAYLMSHAVGDGVKPWKRNFLKSIIVKGIKPSIAEIDYLKYANYPIQVYKPFNLSLKKLNLKLAKLIGRFWSN